MTDGTPALVQAITHALAGGASAYAAELVDRVELQVVYGGEATTIQRWLKALPIDQIQARPFLQLATTRIYHFGLLQASNRDLH